MVKIAIFGAGKAGQYLYDEILKSRIDIDVLGFIDNYPEKYDKEYRNTKISLPEEFFENYGKNIDAVFITAGAQKTLKTMIDICRLYGKFDLYMMHDIAGKCRLPLFDESGIIKARIRKLKFSKDKPSLSYFEVPVTDNCNLNCKGCLFASNITKNVSHIDFSQIEKDCKRMADLFFDIPWIRILGGEPLMHPDIIEILNCYRKSFPDSEIDLCTNGLLIPHMEDEFWSCIRKEHISIHISGYKPTYNLLDKIDSILKCQGIPYVILKREEFYKYYTDNPQNDMNKSFENCCANGCYELYAGRLSSCSAVIAFEKFNHYFGTDYKVRENEDWFDIHKQEIDAWKMKDKLETPSYICKYCETSKMQRYEWDYSSKEVKLEDYII